MELVLQIVVDHVGLAVIGINEIFQILEVLFLLHVSEELTRVWHFAGLAHRLVQGAPDVYLPGVPWANYKFGLFFGVLALRGFQDCRFGIRVAVFQFDRDSIGTLPWGRSIDCERKFVEGVPLLAGGLRQKIGLLELAWFVLSIAGLCLNRLYDACGLPWVELLLRDLGAHI